MASPRLTTAAGLLSDPVAGRVSTQPSGKAALTGALSNRISQGSSPSKQAAAATNLVPSTTDPPPTASRKSMRSRLTRATASIN
ncbi:hypothetical protein D3C74_483610 [compost metagenome]